MNLSMRINKKVENTDMRRLTTGILGKFYVVKHNCVICGVVNDYIMDNYMFRPVLAIFRLLHSCVWLHTIFQVFTHTQRG